MSDVITSTFLNTINTLKLLSKALYPSDETEFFYFPCISLYILQFLFWIIDYRTDQCDAELFMKNIFFRKIDNLLFPLGNFNSSLSRKKN